MINFNLIKFLKEAMSGPNVRYRSEYTWFNLDEIKNNQNEAWETWKQRNPTLKTVEIECLRFQRKSIEEFKRRYNLSENELKKFFTVWIGYSPLYGAYLCSIGPYKFSGNADPENIEKYRRIDRLNRFNFFHRRFQEADASTVDSAYEKYVNEKLSQYKDILTKDDFNFDLKSAKSLKENGSIEWQTVSMNMNSPQMQRMLESRIKPFLGSDSQVNINHNGLIKILKNNAEKYGENLLQQAINITARKRNISPDLINRLLDTGEWNPELVQNKPSAILILNNVLEEFQTFFPVLIRSHASEGNWEDILNLAVEATASEALRDANNNVIAMNPDRIWQILSQDLNISGNNVSIQPVRYPNEEQEIAAIALKNKIIKALIENIKAIKKRMITENKPKYRPYKGRPKDPDEVINQKIAELERLNAIQLPPNLTDFSKKTSGAQSPIGLSVRSSTSSLLELKKEILTHLAQRHNANQPINLQEIANAMTEARRGSKAIARGGEWTEADINLWLDSFEQELEELRNSGRPANFSVLLQNVESDIQEINSELIKGSYKDYATAKRFAGLYFMETALEQIDPGTRAVKFATDLLPIHTFSTENDINMTSENLTQIRHTNGDLRNVTTSDIPRTTEDEIEKQIDLPPSTPPKPPTTEIQPDPEVSVPSSTKENPAQTTEVEPEEEFDEADLDYNPFGNKKSLTNVLNQLIKIAKELDNEGKSDAAEEINVIIRKYIG